MTAVATEWRVRLSVNGEAIDRLVPVRRNLVDFLRQDLGLTGTHVGCEHGVCGACTVRVDGRIVRACLMLAAQADGSAVETIEALAQSPTGAALQQAFLERNAVQCGFCTPGMLLTATDFIDRGGTADRDAIRRHISGNFCRCTGYQSVVDAVASVASGRGRNAS